MQLCRPQPAYPQDTPINELRTAELFVLAAVRLWAAPHRDPGKTHPDWRGSFVAAGHRQDRHARLRFPDAHPRDGGALPARRALRALRQAGRGRGVDAAARQHAAARPDGRGGRDSRALAAAARARASPSPTQWNSRRRWRASACSCRTGLAASRRRCTGYAPRHASPWCTEARLRRVLQHRAGDLPLAHDDHVGAELPAGSRPRHRDAPARGSGGPGWRRAPARRSAPPRTRSAPR